MKNEKDLDMKYLVVKIDDINEYMTETEKIHFWDCFWNMIHTKESKISNDDLDKANL